MELKEAIDILKDYADWTSMLRTQCPDCMGEAIKVVLAELDTITMNYTLLEEKFDGSAEEKVDKLTAELDRQKQVKAEMRKVAWEEGYNQGYLAGAMESI